MSRTLYNLDIRAINANSVIKFPKPVSWCGRVEMGPKAAPSF
jgi:hypothetical protein